jgi:hypothetical protein
MKIGEMTETEIITLFETSCFLETKDGFIRCSNKTNRTIEIISNRDMQELKVRNWELKAKHKK